MESTLAWHELSSSGEGRRVVVFLHGFMGDALEWQAVAAKLCPSYHCIAPDLPGHGRSAADGYANLDDVATAIQRALDEHGVERCGLVGYSLGGRLALYLALQDQTRFESIVLESASPGIADAEEREQRRLQDIQLAVRLSGMDAAAYGEFLREWYQQPLFCTLSGAIETIAAARAHNQPRALARAMHALSVGAQPSLWDQLPQHQAPTLLIVGEKDRKYRIIAERMAEHCPRMAVEVFAGCSHNVHWENLDGYTTALKRFLDATLQ